MSFLDVDLRSAPPTIDEVSGEFSRLHRRMHNRATVLAATGITLLAVIVWLDGARPISDDQIFGVGFLAGIIFLPMLIWWYSSAVDLSMLRPANPIACLKLETEMERPEIALYVHHVQAHGRELTAGEAQALLSIAGYSRAKEEEASLQAAYRRIHSLTS